MDVDLSLKVQKGQPSLENTSKRRADTTKVSGRDIPLLHSGAVCLNRLQWANPQRGYSHGKNDHEGCKTVRRGLWQEGDGFGVPDEVHGQVERLA